MAAPPAIQCCFRPGAPACETNTFYLGISICKRVFACLLLCQMTCVCCWSLFTGCHSAPRRVPHLSVHAWLLRLRTGSDFAPERLPAPANVSHLPTLVRRGSQGDASLGLAWCSTRFFVPFVDYHIEAVYVNQNTPPPLCAVSAFVRRGCSCNYLVGVPISSRLMGA